MSQMPVYNSENPQASLEQKHDEIIKFSSENGGIALRSPLEGKKNTRPMAFVTDSDIAAQILRSKVYGTSDFERAILSFTAFGRNSLLSIKGDDKHSKRKAMLNPEFSPKAIKRQEQRMLDLISSELDKIDTSKEVDLVKLMSLLTIKIICVVILGMPIEGDQINVLTALVEQMEINLGNLFTTQGSPFKTLREFVKVRHSIGKIRQFLKARLNEAMTSVTSSDDLLNKIATDEEYNDTEEKIDDLLMIFFAGNSTTASALTRAFSLILQDQDNPFLDSVYEESRRDELGRPAQLEKLLMETFRRFPPIDSVYRETLEDTTLKNNRGETILILKGTKIEIRLDYINEHITDEDTEFNPNRFDDPIIAKKTREKSKTFGFGIRACLGFNLANTEMVFILREMFRKYNIRLAHPDIDYSGSRKDVVTKINSDDLLVILEEASSLATMKEA